ncbi:uncharacterized protein LOC108917555 isoform X1 [Anoplophora glabripennis]|uniref:uncharacterized protein LOC108917555 isoform X1 n=1 Tax=Anoplophora glabripennis TaxID=217634 RepID=UPI0008743419|nr:uncharacterized protein LOC108917555 isoform X1 [Anoplophora glabripennis]XP_018579726.1 uncharacterized protein LOC108917555 isoform X1 [Anoplophora glabripennis]
MLRSLNPRFLRNLTKYFRKRNINATIYHTKPFILARAKVLIGSQLCCVALKSEERTKINVEDGLREACAEGDVAIVVLMDTLKDFVLVVCQEYRSCLTKQIEITETASKIGPLSEFWDELPPYRTLAAELSKELDDYMSVFNTIGQMMTDDSLVSFVTGTTDKLDLVATKYQELNTLLQKEFEQNREIELELLRINRNSILNSVN